MITIEEIAQKAGLSRYTVSKVLNGHPSVRASTREKILQICRESGYIPNLNALSLVRGKSPLLGLILPYTTDAFYSKMLEKLEIPAREKGYILIYKSSYNDPEKEKEAILEFLSMNVSGLFIVPVVKTPDKEAHLLAAKNVPVLYLDRPFSDDSYCVFNDNYASASCMTELLLTHTENVAFLDSFYGKSNPAAASRRKGYVDTMKKYSLKTRIITAKNPVWQQDNEQYGYEVMKSFFASEKSCRGLFCITDAAAVGAGKAAREAGWIPGKDFFIGGHDNLSFSAYMDPPLTTMEQPIDKMSGKLLDLFERLVRNDPPLKKHFLYKSRLIQRESC